MATLVRWTPFTELAQLQNELSRFMNGLEGNVRATQSWIPTADVWETEHEVVYAFDLPGIPEEKIVVELADGALRITAEREREETREEGRYHRVERRYGSFTRTIGVPQGVTEADVKASYENGVLEVRIAKPELPKPRKIEIGKTAIEGNSKRK